MEERYWPIGAHFGDNWEYVGSFCIKGKMKGDVYIGKDINKYSGVSIQYGQKENEYASSSYIYQEDIPCGVMDSMLRVYAFAFDRIKSRS